MVVVVVVVMVVGVGLCARKSADGQVRAIAMATYSGSQPVSQPAVAEIVVALFENKNNGGKKKKHKAALLQDRTL